MALLQHHEQSGDYYLMDAPEPRQSVAEPAFPLGLAARGDRVRVVALTGNARNLEKRLEAMGIRVGTELEILQHEGGSTVVRIGGSRVALGVAMMHRVQVAALRG